MKLIDSPDCNHCNQIDTVIHRFIECDDVFRFWNEILQYFNGIHNTDLNLSKEQIILGITDNTQTPITVSLNIYILIAKYWIHVSRLKKNKPEIYGFKRFLYKHIENEKYIHTMHETLDKFNETWNVLYTNLT